MWKKRLGIPLVVVIGLLLTAGGVYAALSAGEKTYLWDVASNPSPKYEPGNAVYPWDGTWESVLHPFKVDQGLVSTTVPISYYTGPTGCYTDNDQTSWGGLLKLGLAHEDSGKAAWAPAFQESRRWELVDCDRDGDGDWDGGDLAVAPKETRRSQRCALGFECQEYYTSPTTFTEDRYGLWLQSQDVVTPCTSNDCNTEIMTTLYINLDPDCDGDRDIFFSGDMCFYAEARVPPPPELITEWAGNVHVRIQLGSGDKTVNTTPLYGEPTSIILRAFQARWLEGRSLPVGYLAAAALLAAAVTGVVTWQVRRARP